MADDPSDPGPVLVVNSQPCDRCVSESSQFPSSSIFIDTISSPSGVKFYAAQIVTTYPPPPGSVTTNHETTTSTSKGPVYQSSVSSASSGESKSSHNITSFSYEPTSPLPTSSTSGTTSKSSADTVRVHHILRSALAVYTVTFTLFLIPIPKMNPFEFILISTTCITGWILLYLDTLITFLHDPHQQVTFFMKSFNLGLLNYIVERWYTFQIIRRRNQPHTTLRYPPPNISRGSSFHLRLGAWWKSDILSNLKRHDLRDYFDNPTQPDFTLEKYRPPTTVPRHDRDDIFSSDEDLDTSPLATKLKLPKYRRATTPQLVPPQTLKEDSKETCVDEGISGREKVSGFIAWDALKRPSAENAIEKAETEGSGSSWEREVLGVGI